MDVDITTRAHGPEMRWYMQLDEPEIKAAYAVIEAAKEWTEEMRGVPLGRGWGGKLRVRVIDLKRAMAAEEVERAEK